MFDMEGRAGGPGRARAGHARVVSSRARQRTPAIEERAVAHILAVMLDKVEGVEDCGSITPPTGTTPRTVTSRQARAQPPSPSIVKPLVLNSSAAAAMADSLAFSH
jgi:hypothetical protein